MEIATKEQYLQLVKEAAHHSFLYYNQDNPELSDFEYDQLTQRIKSVEAEHPDWVVSESPTQHVGGEAVMEGAKKVQHRVQLASLNDLFSFDEVKAWYESIGAPETVVEQVKVSRYPGFWQVCKIVFVCCICFFGAAFTIMAFHNDIGIREVFGQIYELLTGQEPQSVTALEIAYSIGLALGILVFFNHIGGRRITSDPTPIEVEMRKYETDVNQALTETADREKKTLDV